jgi:hypothetical protein
MAAHPASTTSETQKLFLVDPPQELQLKIYKLASIHKEPISPELWFPLRRSRVNNIFARGYEYLDLILAAGVDPDRNKGRLPGAFTAVDLATTCKSIRNLVLGSELLFYKYHNFDFTCMTTMHKYLAAIIPSRRNAIKSIQVLFDIHNDPASAFIMLSACRDLEHLTLDITFIGERFQGYEFWQTPGVHQLIQLRGLRSFKLTCGDKTPTWNFLEYVHETIRNEEMTPQSEINLRFEVAILEKIINDAVSRETKANCDITRQEVQEAIQKPGVNPRIDEFQLQPTAAPDGVQKNAEDASAPDTTISASQSFPSHGGEDSGKEHSPPNSVQTYNLTDRST